MGDQTRSVMDTAQSARDQASIAIHSKASRCELGIIPNPPDAALCADGSGSRMESLVIEGSKES